jgi:ribonuclease P protein component
MIGEENLPAQGPPASASPRFPPSDGDPSRSQHRVVTPPPRSGKAVGIGIERLHRRADFQALAASPRRGRAGLVGVSYLPDREVRAFAYGTKGIVRAVDRNRRRRQLRALVAGLVVDQPKLVPLGAYLVVVRSGTATSSELAAWLKAALRIATSPSPGG